MQTHGARKKRCRFFLRNKIQEQNISLHRCFRRSSGRGLPGSDATRSRRVRKNCAVPLGRPENFLVSQLAHCGCAVCGPPCAQARTTNYSRISPTTRPSENVHSKRHAASLSSLDEAFLLDKDGADTARDAERSAVALHDARATEPCCLV